MSEPKRINIKEFREFGYLQEVNRQFFHPLGLALEVVIEEDGSMRLGGVWDYRDEPDGMAYASSDIDADKAARVQVAWHEKEPARIKNLGYVIQPVDW